MKKNNHNSIQIVSLICIVLLLIITISGILSFSNDKSYEFTNLYGDVIKIFGSGIYQNNSYFRVPIFIGSDITMLIIVVPILIKYAFTKTVTLLQKIHFFSILGVTLYYALSIALGITYNQLHLIYIFLVAISFFPFFILLFQIYDRVKDVKIDINTSKGELIFLFFCGISLFIAWLPDIITSLLSSTSLELIEIYTTDITYVLDIGIVSPLIFIIIYLLKKQKFIGLVLEHMMFTLLKVIGIMLPIQSLFQMLAGIDIPLPALIIKVFIFVALALFALYFDKKIVRNIKTICIATEENNKN